MKVLLFSLVLSLATLTACNTVEQDSEDNRYTGKITQTGITTYQYGTHTLTNDDTFYALTSETVDLDKYVGKRVTLKAKEMEDYPVDGGPEYLKVTAVEE